MHRNDYAQLCEQLGDVAYGEWAAVVEALRLYPREQVKENPWLPYLVLALLQAQANGHVCLDLRRVAGSNPWTMDSTGQPCQGFQFPDLETLHAGLQAMQPLNPDDPTPLQYDAYRLYTRRMWHLEQELADRLWLTWQQGEQDGRPERERVRTTIEALFTEKPLEGEDVDWQRVAVAHAIGHRLTVLTGGPGTGKTTTVTRLLVALQTLSAHPLKIALAAPTGKAAQRLTESVALQKAQLADLGVAYDLLETVPTEACTLHRLLGVRGGGGGFVHGKDRPLDVDVLVVDEVSMVDLPLMTALFRAIKEKTRVVLLGDPGQLPAVGVGGILAELVREDHEHYSQACADWIEATTGEKVPVTEHVSAPWHTALVHSRRFEAGGGIGQLAEALQRGEKAWVQSLLSESRAPDLCWHPEWDMDTLIQVGLPYWKALLEAKTPEEAFRTLATFRVLTPLRQGPWGVEQINARIEAQLNAESGTKRGPWYKGRPIMVTLNHYGVGLFNGDIGLIWEEDGQWVAYFETGDKDRFRKLPVQRLPDFEPVYAMTIHKTQGTEFDHVLMLLPQASERLLSRELIFTGLTRAKQRFTLMAEPCVLETGVLRRVTRDGGLRARLHAKRHSQASV